MGIQCVAISYRLWLVRNCSDCSAGGVHFAIVLPNGNTLRPTREAGLVQIANALSEEFLRLCEQRNACASRGPKPYLVFSPGCTARREHHGFQTLDSSL